MEITPLSVLAVAMTALAVVAIGVGIGAIIKSILDQKNGTGARISGATACGGYAVAMSVAIIMAIIYLVVVWWYATVALVMPLWLLVAPPTVAFIVAIAVAIKWFRFPFIWVPGLIMAITTLLVAMSLFIWGVAPAFGQDDNGNTVELPKQGDVTVAMTVDLDSLQVAQYDSISWVFLESSISTHDAERVAASGGISDALTMPFAAGDDAGKIAEVKTEILRNPIYGVGFANFLKDKKVGDYRLGEYNPWMEEMVSKNISVNYWLEYRDDGSTIYVKQEYRKYAAGLCTFLDRLVSQGVQTRQTAENWCLNPSLSNNERKAVPASYQYAKETLVFTYTAKNDAALFEFGLNIHDKRYETFTEVKEEKKTTVTETSHSPAVTTIIEKVTAPPTKQQEEEKKPPTKKEDDTKQPPTKAVKDPSESSRNQGNAEDAFSNQPDDGAGQQQGEHDATATDGSPTAGNDDGSGKPSNQVQNPNANQDNSTAPPVQEIPVTTDTTVTDNNSGQTTNTSEEQHSDGKVVLPD